MQVHLYKFILLWQFKWFISQVNTSLCCNSNREQQLSATSSRTLIFESFWKFLQRNHQDIETFSTEHCCTSQNQTGSRKSGIHPKSEECSQWLRVLEPIGAVSVCFTLHSRVNLRFSSTGLDSLYCQFRSSPSKLWVLRNLTADWMKIWREPGVDIMADNLQIWKSTVDNFFEVVNVCLLILTF